MRVRKDIQNIYKIYKFVNREPKEHEYNSAHGKQKYSSKDSQIIQLSHTNRKINFEIQNDIKQ